MDEPVGDRPRGALAWVRALWRDSWSWLVAHRVEVAVALALALLPIAVADSSRLDEPLVLTIAIAGLCVAPVVLLVWRPLVAWAFSAATVWGIAYGDPVANGNPWPWPVTFGLVLILTVVLVGATSRVLVTLVVAFLSAVLVGGYSAPGAQAGWAAGLVLFAAGGVVLGWSGRLRRQLAVQEELSDVEKARRTVLEERARIARDLHDVVAHRMSLVVVAAETAPFRVPGVSPAMRTELTAIAATAREALAEMRGLLGVLRGADESPVYAPQPRLADMPTLVDDAVRAGVPVTFAVTGAPRELRSAVELGAYRIVQESLANAARHAPGAPVDVRLAYGAESLGVEITNGPGDAARPTGSTPAGTGHGLPGMAERAAVAGGSLHAGPLPDGGFRVRATLPLTGPPGTSAT